jgi:hypothetical protein
MFKGAENTYTAAPLQQIIPLRIYSSLPRYLIVNELLVLGY